MFCPFINCTTGPGSYSAFRVADALIPSDSQLCLPWSQGHVPWKCKMVERTVPGWKGGASLGSFSDCNLSLSHPAVAPCCSPGLTFKEPRYSECHSMENHWICSLPFISFLVVLKLFPKHTWNSHPFSRECCFQRAMIILNRNNANIIYSFPFPKVSLPWSTWLIHRL